MLSQVRDGLVGWLGRNTAGIGWVGGESLGEKRVYYRLGGLHEGGGRGRRGAGDAANGGVRCVGQGGVCCTDGQPLRRVLHQAGMRAGVHARESPGSEKRMRVGCQNREVRAQGDRRASEGLAGYKYAAGIDR